jgi:asparagine synthase (glutamine-hydrolysing)
MDRDLSAEQGASATFTGEGGDSTLCAITYSYAVEHAFRHHGLARKTWLTAWQVASRRDRTVWKVLGKAIGREIFGAGRADELRRRATFNRLVSLEAKRAMDGRPVGTTWLSTGGHLSQEIRLRLGALLFPPVFYDLSTSASAASPYIASPLCAQPVVEACLRIPAHLHFDGGRIRGLARRAFADVLPAPIVQRQWKDRPMLFFEDVVQANLHFIRERLLDGELAKRGILDRAQVELALAEVPSRGSAECGEILSQLDLELWVHDSIRCA